ncbi:ABC transporter substrate-binding protein [Actinopolymorpha cephalotaxi]|uniref:Peptide/nickel transport system substrate-binding protein n=1 Tax=Actinopolymorpha cephalotaxi TaxID=504797 RepID=A0ABX2SA39_9ACTN|nr:ABC transporter substrate-binding protein [Actinopolymorpha cephalotaxi]NYH85305.1 peptide/nickel transport system substrate-binding protein [Actinopolymorpha cephalotaxi]
MSARSTGPARRRFLYGCAVLAGSVSLGACSTTDRGEAGAPSPTPKRVAKGSVRKPLSPPKQLHEAPSLREKMRAGQLPPVAQRLPKHPYVIPHRWTQTGSYGGNMRLITTATTDGSSFEYMYGRSPLRWLNDGLDIAPGLVESWSSNDDASEWTLHVREGLRWSDGQPVTSADAVYWWHDLVQNKDHPSMVPDSARSGNGTPMSLTAPDDLTLVLRFDAPTPLLPLYLANLVNAPEQGVDWFLPKHYLKRWHPAYNKSIKGQTWPTAHDQKSNFLTNPDCPTLTGWRVRTYDEGQAVRWERNPYYWCVDRAGNQLPYVDTLTMTAVQDPQVAKLKLQQGECDFTYGYFLGLTMGDAAGLKQAQSRSGTKLHFWDSGSASGSVFFLNYDYQDPQVRKLIREPRFRQALSHAFDRAEAQKSIYFNTGEKTTGTYSPMAIEYQVNKEGQSFYERWRDSYVAHDPAKAKKLLDELGVVDADGDGWRERPDGRPLKLSIDFPAGASEEHQRKNNLLKRDWEKIGIHVALNPVPPTSFQDQWATGKLMSQSAWDVGDGPDHLTGPWWFVPIETSRWAPLHGQWWQLQGTPQERKQADLDPWKRTPPRVKPESGGPIDRLWKLFATARTEPDTMKRYRAVWEMIKIHLSDGLFYQGTVANYPIIVYQNADLANVPLRTELAQGGGPFTWAHPLPAVYDPESWYWSDPAKRKSS